MSNPINPCLWFDGQARAIADFYAATFPDARLLGGSSLVVSIKVGDLKFLPPQRGPAVQDQSFHLILLQLRQRSGDRHRLEYPVQGGKRPDAARQLPLRPKVRLGRG